MSKTLLRGLELIETVGRHGPLTVSELARLTGVDVTIVSRTVSACEPEGWLTKDRGRITVGPRCALLGLTSPVHRLIAGAEPIVQAIGGVTGTAVTASALVGGDVMILASFGNGAPDAMPDGLLSRTPVHLLAAGRAIAAQLPPERLAALLPPAPFPGPEGVLASLEGSDALPSFLADFTAGDAPAASLPTTAAELEAELEDVRAGGFARDRGAIHPSVRCIAIPWPTGVLPASLACSGPPEAVEGASGLIEACLTAAAKPGARGLDVAAAAAAA
jgi:DNA-binding IclR family transcriptional regulator